MKFFYTFSIHIYYIVIRLISPFHKKAGQWREGRRNWFPRLQQALRENKKPVVWMHCSSLGEFEQGRPVLEALRENGQDLFLIVSFFSPSGYEIRKNFTQADYVCYLPKDTRKNARLWIQEIQPRVALFVKYEFWYYYLNELKRNQIPTLLISANFREEQLFFKWYGKWYRNMLSCFSLLFVQRTESARLLDKFGIGHYTVSGDTRFDRVAAIPDKAKRLEQIEKFTSDQLVVIAGSSWEPDENFLVRYIQSRPNHAKYIIVPHEIKEAHLKQLSGKLNGNAIRWSKFSSEDLNGKRVVIIDNVGMLSSLYRYAGIAIIGGGFGKGIHNILEAATFGMPVLFGPNYKKFREATDMVSRKCAFPFSSYPEFEKNMDMLIQNHELRKRISISAAQYVKDHTGATQKILNEIRNLGHLEIKP